MIKGRGLLPQFAKEREVLPPEQDNPIVRTKRKGN